MQLLLEDELDKIKKPLEFQWLFYFMIHIDGLSGTSPFHITVMLYTISENYRTCMT
ncbi:MAG: hypothetical protein ACXWB9_09010 [Flavisolibacter sp.]